MIVSLVDMRVKDVDINHMVDLSKSNVNKERRWWKIKYKTFVLDEEEEEIKITLKRWKGKVKKNKKRKEFSKSNDKRKKLMAVSRTAFFSFPRFILLSSRTLM